MLPAHLTVGSPKPRTTAYVLHGVLGAGNNFRSFIGRVSALRPAWRFVLVDLRHHGKSQGAPPPHTIEACVDDLEELDRELGQRPSVLIGHSFGGKVALAYARRRDRATERQPSLDQVWTLDSDPGSLTPPPDHQVLQVLAALRRTPGPFASRQAAVQMLMGESGFSSGLAQWLVTNLERRGEQLVWRLDLDAIEELLDDYFRQDFWPYLTEPREHPIHHLVVAERSDRWTGEMRARAESLPEAAAVVVHELPDAGHWVHVDNPDGLLEMLHTHLSPA